MDLEVVVVGLIGIAGTLLGALSTFYFDERRENRTRKTENWNKVVDEVYSPLIFDLRSIKDWGILQRLRIMSKLIPALQERQTSEQVPASLTFILQVTDHRESRKLEDTLRKNTRLIRPSDLWDDLFMFCDTLKLIEENLSMMSTGVLLKSPDKLIAGINSFIRISVKLDEAAEYLIAETKNIALMDKPPKSLKYQPFFTESIRKDLVKELDESPMFQPNED
jgi:hypothetical protein